MNVCSDFTAFYCKLIPQYCHSKNERRRKNKTTKLLLVHKSSFAQERKTHCNAIVLAPQQSTSNNTQMAHSSVEIVIHFIQFQAGANSSSWPSRQFPIYQLFFFSSALLFIFYVLYFLQTYALSAFSLRIDFITLQNEYVRLEMVKWRAIERKIIATEQHSA